MRNVAFRALLLGVSTVGSARSAAIAADPPYPPSPVLRTIEWAPLDSVRRAARGGDNWPVTWGDDGALYTAYGDGHGFEPFVPRKLSLGFCRVEGGPADFRGANVRAPTLEAVGDGPSGRKASGILMVRGVLYLWARNSPGSRLASSRDRGRTWTWVDWSLRRGFGAATFLNFRKNYAGARDEYVYTYSFDANDAYTAADRMVLARAPAERLTDRSSWEFLERVAPGRPPVWTKDIERRGAVFVHAGRCYRSGITYSAALKRYLWVQVHPGARTRAKRSRDRDPRFGGGFGVYDAPEPWGPWTTVYFTERWDTGPGESASLPTKWMSADGLTAHLVFSGEDCFSVRRGTLVPKR